MFQHPTAAEMQAEQHRKELMAEAEQWRLVHHAPHGPKTPSLRDQILLGVAKGLIRAGTLIEEAQRLRSMQDGCETC